MREVHELDRDAVASSCQRASRENDIKVVAAATSSHRPDLRTRRAPAGCSVVQPVFQAGPVRRSISRLWSVTRLAAETEMGSSTAMTVVCVIAALVSLQLAAEVSALEFDYTTGPKGPANWGDLKSEWATCKTGQRQSPLAITADIIVTDRTLNRLDADFPKHRVPSDITNNGHGIELGVEDAVTLKIGNLTYKSKQMHFHYPSEHTILDYTFPLEMHLVHTTEVDGVTKIAVIGYLFVLGEENPFLAQFFDNLPEEGAQFPIDPIQLLKARGAYGRYTGSLTTPPCTEDVTWTVLLWNFPTVSQKQLDQLKAVLPPSARPTFAGNGRKFSIKN